MIRDNPNNSEILAYLESCAFTLARGLVDNSIVSWDDLAGICDQRYYSLKAKNPVPLNEALLNVCDRSIQPYLA